MSTVVVLDTDFLSAFLKIQRLSLVRDFYDVEEVWIPAAVYREIAAIDLIAVLSALPWTTLRSPDTERFERLVAEHDLEGLGLGELQAMALALGEGPDGVLLTNDNHARQKASELGIEVVNIPAFLLACKQTGFLARQEVGEIVVALEREDHYGFRRKVRELLVQ